MHEKRSWTQNIRLYHESQSFLFKLGLAYYQAYLSPDSESFPGAPPQLVAEANHGSLFSTNFELFSAWKKGRMTLTMHNAYKVSLIYPLLDVKWLT